jgi:hypothetical protein
MSSHREAPEISKDPVADSTDVYAFVSPDQPGTVTLIANYVPLQLPSGGPNFYEFGDDVLYKIHIDNNGDGRAEISYQFRFSTQVSDPDTFLYNTGPIESINSPNWNRRQSVTDPGLDGAQRDVQQFGHLAVAVPAVVGQGDRLALHLGQAVQAAPDPFAVQACFHCLGDLIVWRADVDGLVFAVGRGRRGADTVDGAAMGDGHHPRRRATHGRVEPRRGPPHLEEDLLGDLLGLGRIPENPADDAVHRAGHPVIQRLERHLVATCHVDEQVV